MKTPKGFTLVELMVSIVVMLVAIIAACAVMIAVAAFSRNTENMSDSYDAARLAGEALNKSLRSAGLFAPGGIYVNSPAGTGTLINPVYGTSGGAAATDELWVLEPDKNAFREPCVDPGAAITLTADSTSPDLTIKCAATPALAASDYLVAANLKTGALLTPPLTLSATSIKSSDPATFGNPGGTKYAKADTVVYRVYPWHYFIKVDPATNRPALMRHRAAVGTTAAAPLVDDAAAPDELVQAYVEDLQVVYGTAPSSSGDPTQIAETDTLAPAVVSGTSLRTVRLSVVAVSRQTKQSSSGTVATVNGPMKLEDHSTVGANDGFQRGVYIRRLELPNMAPGIL